MDRDLVALWRRQRKENGSTIGQQLRKERLSSLHFEEDFRRTAVGGYAEDVLTEREKNAVGDRPARTKKQPGPDRRWLAPQHHGRPATDGYFHQLPANRKERQPFAIGRDHHVCDRLLRAWDEPRVQPVYREHVQPIGRVVNDAAAIGRHRKGWKRREPEI